MELKYNQFCYENQIYDTFEFWNLYDKFGEEVYDKYNGKIYCPLCCTAPLTIVRRGKRYFKVSKKNMHLHADDCSNKLEEASRKETSEFYENASEQEIVSRLDACMYYLLKKTVQNRHEDSATNDEPPARQSFLTIKTSSGRKVRLPQKFLRSGLSEDDYGTVKIYYGECRLYWLINEKYKYLKVLNEEAKELCSLKISDTVFGYLSQPIKDIATDKHNAEKYYICFATEFKNNSESKKIYYNGTLRYSSHILIKKVNSDKN